MGPENQLDILLGAVCHEDQKQPVHPREKGYWEVLGNSESQAVRLAWNQLGAQCQATAWSSGTSPSHWEDTLSSQDAVSPPDPVLPRQATPGGEGQMPACLSDQCPLWTVGPKGPGQRAQSLRAGHKGPQAAAWRVPRYIAVG